MLSTKPNIEKRILATVIDYTIIYFVFYVFLELFGEPDEEGGTHITGMVGMFPFLFWFIYLPISEWKFGATMGHQLFKLKIVSLSKRPLTLTQTLKRRLADPIDLHWCFGLLAFLLVKNTQFNQRFGDIWAKTIVVKSEKTIVWKRLLLPELSS